MHVRTGRDAYVGERTARLDPAILFMRLFRGHDLVDDDLPAIRIKEDSVPVRHVHPVPLFFHSEPFDITRSMRMVDKTIDMFAYDTKILVGNTFEELNRPFCDPYLHGITFTKGRDPSSLCPT